MKNSIAVVPLAIPLLTGPGSISTVIIYAASSAHWYDRLGLIVIGAVLAAICFSVRCASPNRLRAGSGAPASTSARG